METETTFRDYTGVTTEQMVVQQLTENTGRALCDSGDAYGRNWQRNQGKDFSAAPAVTVSWDAFRARDEEHLPGQLMLCGTVDLYHWMTRNLEFDAELQAQLDEFAAREENEDSSWLQIQEEFADYLHDRDGHEAEPRVINTYNDPDGRPSFEFEGPDGSIEVWNFATGRDRMAALQAMARQADQAAQDTDDQDDQQTEREHRLNAFDAMTATAADVQAMGAEYVAQLLDDLEDINYHTEGLILQALAAGREDLAARARANLREHLAAGYLTDALRLDRQAIGEALRQSTNPDPTRAPTHTPSSASGPRLNEQQAIEWAAALRDESIRIQKAEAKAKPEVSKTGKLPVFPVDSYRLERFYANGAKIKPLPARKFNPEEVQSITDWFKSIGWSVTSGSGANGINATNDIGMTIDDLPDPYTAAQRKKDDERRASDERSAVKKNEQGYYLASTAAGKFVAGMFGDAMNSFNQTALAKVLSGDEKVFVGLFSNRSVDVLAEAGIATEGREIKDVIRDIKARFEAAPTDAAKEPDQAPELATVDACSESEASATTCDASSASSTPSAPQHGRASSRPHQAPPKPTHDAHGQRIGQRVAGNSGHWCAVMFTDPDNVDLSQVLQYVELYTEDRHEPSHLIVSVHGGCDVRGGYTHPVVYRLRYEYYEAMAEARVSCVYTSDFSWDFSAGGSCNGCSDGAPVEDVFALPAFALDWIADREIESTIEACRRHIKDAEYICGPSAEAQESLVRKMEERIAELEKERFEAAVQHLVSNYEASVLVDKGRAWLIDESCWEAEYVKDEMELKGGNGYF